MDLPSKTAPQLFSLLSIGHRGVGKTVFLAGSYAELHADSHTDHNKQLWFDCQDSQAQENIESILSYVARTGKYPPLTIKITNFNFSLKHHSLWGTQTLCDFRWWDIPGESCNIHNRDFQTMVSNSQGCCVFIDAHALVHEPAYRQAFENVIIDQVMPIANLVHLNRLRYAFALILTKYDLLVPGTLSRQQINEGLQPLTSRLDAVRANYQTFYSSIPIVHTESASILKATGAADPLLWLVCQLNLAHNPRSKNNLLEFVTPLLPSRFQPQQAILERALHSQIKPARKALRVTKILGLDLQPANYKYILLLTVVMVSLLGVISTFKVKNVVASYEQDRRSKTRDLNAMRKSVSLVEQRVQEEPEYLELRLQLAKLYERTNQFYKAEIAYDQVLAQQKNNLNALIGKANLRHLQGDKQAAKMLFAQAEQTAPPTLKTQIRALARQTLQLSAKPIPPSK